MAPCPDTTYSEWSKLGPYCVKYFPHPVPFDQAEVSSVFGLVQCLFLGVNY